MKQALQYQKTGTLTIREVPAPELLDGMIIVRTKASLISAGTERTSVATAQASMIGKARSRPDLVRQAIDMVKKDGLRSTVDKIRTRLDSYKSLGYSAAGVVIASACDEFAVGDNVACAGATASHAEVIAVPKNLAVKIPDGVSFDEAAFTTLGAIAMQGVRQAKINLGESVAVIGLGLLGQLTVQLLKAAGCRVIGLDINEAQFALAKEFGADAVALSNAGAISTIESFTHGVGCDAVIITASTSSSEPIELAIKSSRKKGRVVIVGAIGMDIQRSPFYEKELDITISCSYGPGRYDPTYEDLGQDYPIGYVRWTERRNMASVLDLMAAGKLNVERIITHRIAISDAERAYDLITGKIKEPYIGIVLQYPDRGVDLMARSVRVDKPSAVASKDSLRIGFIGAGNFAQSYLIPPAKESGAQLIAVSTSTAASASTAAEKFGFQDASTDAKAVFNRSDVDAVFIATRHDTHGDYVLGALKAGKQVFVEKPLAITIEELNAIADVASSTNDRVMVGFNRRFSEPFVAMKKFIGDSNEPMVMSYRVNAGHIAPEHWVQSVKQGGRIIGEGCHFIDCMQYLCGARPISVYAAAIGAQNAAQKNADNVSITVRFSDGSVGTLHYLANGDPSISKEYMEVFSGGRTAIMNNFTTLHTASGRKTKIQKFGGAKGHAEEVAQTIKAMQSGSLLPISFQSLYDTTLVTIAAHWSLQSGEVIMLSDVDA